MIAIASPKLLLVDGHAYAYRAFHAIRELTSPEGSPTNAIYGFVSMLSRMLTKVEPTHAAVVWDGGLDASRLELIPGYKAERPEMPDSLSAQIDQLQDLLPDLGLVSLCHEGVEADDWIGALAKRMAKEGGDVVIASSDKDFMQLVCPRICLLNPNTKDDSLWKAEEVRVKTGVNPDQVVDWLSLMGDAVDNIPGVPGIGPKTAAELLRTFGTIEEIFDRLPEVSPERIRLALESSRDRLSRNQQMIRLKIDRCEPQDLAELLLRPASSNRLAEQYRRWGFRRLLAEVESHGQPQLELLTGA